MDKYQTKQDARKVVESLQDAPSRMYDPDGVKYNIDNCECPECPCCDPDTKWLWPVGAPVLAASTGILLLAVAKDVATGGD